MSYADADKLRDTLGAAVYDSIYKGVHADKAAADLDASAAIMDSYLAARYIVPVTATGADDSAGVDDSAGGALPLLAEWNAVLAMENAYQRAGGATIPEKVKDRVKRVYDQLRDAAKGVLRLPANPAEAEDAVGGALIMDCDEPVFTRETMQGY